MPEWLRFLLAALAVWRITHLLIHEDGPWKLVARFRGRLEGGSWGSLVGCFKCLSIWIAVPFVLFVGGDWVERAVVWLALSGLAILLEEQLTGPLLVEEGESDELLRRRDDDVRAEIEDTTEPEIESGSRGLPG